MKKLSIFALILMVLSCNKTTLIEPVVALTCDDTSVFEYSNGLKYTFDNNNKVVKLEQKVKPVSNTYNLQYDKSLLIFTNKYISSNYGESLTFQLNDKGSIKSYEDISEGTSKKGLYEYDSENRLIRISVIYSSINNPNLFQTYYQTLKWENDNIVRTTYLVKYASGVEEIRYSVNFEYGNMEILDKDNFYNLAFFDSPNINVGGLLNLDYLGLSKGKSPKNVPVRYTITDSNGQIRDGGVGEYSYQVDKFNRLTEVKISNNITKIALRSFNYLCH